MIGSKNSWPFLTPVDKESAPDYDTIVSDPIDISMITKRLKQGDYYRCKDIMYHELQRMVSVD